MSERQKTYQKLTAKRDFALISLFLGTGKHAREDIPRLLQELCQQYPECRFELMTAAGENPRVTALLAQLAIEACRGESASYIQNPDKK